MGFEKMIKYAVFDWDGTLADTYPVLYAAYCDAAHRLGIPNPSFEDVQNITGSVQNKNVLKALFKDKAQEASVFFHHYIENNHIQNLKMVSGAEEVLNFCLQNHIEPLLLTNKTQKYLSEELHHLNLQGYFKNIVTAGLYQEDKPHPIACKALFEGKIPPHDEIIVIGDGGSDIKAAEVYGAKSIILGTNVKGNYNIKNLVEAIDIIKGNPS